jgi:hypothetical protein
MSLSERQDVAILRELAEEYAHLAAQPEMDARRELWRAHFSLEPTRPPVLVTYGMWNVWCREVFGDQALACQDPFYREHEQALRLGIFHHTIGDDFVLEPWITLLATLRVPRGIYGEPWGATPRHVEPGVEGGAWKSQGFLQTWDDVQLLVPPPHEIDEEATARDLQRLQDAVGDLLVINADRGPVLSRFAGDISTTIASLRGLEQLMLDLYEAPRELHHLLAYLRDGILGNQRQAEEAGNYGLANSNNQAVPYARELPDPAANALGRRRSGLWGFSAAQEYTLVSPAQHDAFLLQYQLPIMRHYGLVHYGCCEDLTRKIDMLRQIENLRSIAVTPRADVRRCAEQIGCDYVISWRPNPTDMVSTAWDEGQMRAILREGLAACVGGHVHIHLKDVETVQGEPERLARWTAIVREEIEHFSWQA